MKRLGATLFVFTEKKHQWTSDNWYQEADSVKKEFLIKCKEINQKYANKAYYYIILLTSLMLLNNDDKI